MFFLFRASRLLPSSLSYVLTILFSRTEKKYCVPRVFYHHGTFSVEAIIFSFVSGSMDGLVYRSMGRWGDLWFVRCDSYYCARLVTPPRAWRSRLMLLPILIFVLYIKISSSRMRLFDKTCTPSQRTLLEG